MSFSDPGLRAASSLSIKAKCPFKLNTRSASGNLNRNRSSNIHSNRPFHNMSLLCGIHFIEQNPSGPQFVCGLKSKREIVSVDEYSAAASRINNLTPFGYALNAFRSICEDQQAKDITKIRHEEN